MVDHPLTGRTRQIAEAISSAIRTSRSRFSRDATIGDMAEAVDKMMSRLTEAESVSSAKDGRRIYVASRASIPERGAMWREWRAKGVPINSTWIDEDGPKASRDLVGLWDRIRREVTSAERLILYGLSGKRD